jgi:LPS-assembly lipoprotein
VNSHLDRTESARSGRFFPVLFVVGTILLPSCGFHLRGMYTPAAWPAELADLRVLVAGKDAEYDALRQAVVQSLQSQAKVKITSGLPVKDSAKVPVLNLDRETIRTQPLAVTPGNVKVAQALIIYATGFTLLDHEGRTLMEPQLIRLRRSYEYDTTTVVAKRYEQDELVQVMREEAAQLILERVSAYRVKHADQRG